MTDLTIAPDATAVELEPLIEVSRLSKDYFYKRHAIPALTDVTFSIAAGQFVGLFGPNGAGKTTTTKIVVGLMRPKTGTVTVAGHDALRTSAAKRLIGYVPQSGSLLASLTVLEELTFHARSFGLGRAAAIRQAHEVAELLEIEDLLDRDVQALSGGQRRRVEIAMALVHRPRVLILDEPTLGLDPHTRAGLWDAIRHLREQLGTTILMTTHYLDEASKLMDRVLIMDHGRVVAAGTPAEIVADHATGEVELGPFDEPEALVDLVEHALRTRWADICVAARGDRLVIRCASPETVLPAAVVELQERGVGVDEATATPPTVSDAFFAITGRRLPG